VFEKHESSSSSSNNESIAHVESCNPAAMRDAFCEEPNVFGCINSALASLGLDAVDWLPVEGWVQQQQEEKGKQQVGHGGGGGFAPPQKKTKHKQSKTSSSTGGSSSSSSSSSSSDGGDGGGGSVGSSGSSGSSGRAAARFQEMGAFISETQQLHAMYLERLQDGLSLVDTKLELQDVTGISEVPMCKLPEACAALDNGSSTSTSSSSSTSTAAAAGLGKGVGFWRWRRRRV
jgi:hypothetical protein